MCLSEIRLICSLLYNMDSSGHLLRTYNSKMQDLLFYYENNKKNPHVETI